VDGLQRRSDGLLEHALGGVFWDILEESRLFPRESSDSTTMEFVYKAFGRALCKIGSFVIRMVFSSLC
jgi:hypothetical protein